MSRKVLVITQIIQPGGGPAGYVHNLKEGIETLKQQQLLNNLFEFQAARVSSKRTKPSTQNSVSIKTALRSLAVKLIKKSGLNKLLSSRQRLLRNSIKNADLVVFQGFQDVGLLLYSKKIRIPVVYMPHSPSVMADEYRMLCTDAGSKFNLKKYAKFKNDEQTLIKNSSAVIFPSPGAAEEYFKSFSQDLANLKVLYLKSGVSLDLSIYPLTKKLPASSKPKILFVGRYVSHKGYDIFCDAAKILSQKQINAYFETVGQGPLKIDTECIFDHGWKNDVFSVIEKAAIVVIPNRIAYYDLLPIECAALGKGLVMTDVGGNKDQIKDFPDSVSCSVPSPAALAEAIEKAMTLKKANADWGINNRKSYLQEFTREAFAKRWDDAISFL